MKREKYIANINNNMNDLKVKEEQLASLQNEVRQLRKRVSGQIRSRDRMKMDLLKGAKARCEICSKNSQEIHHIIPIAQQVNFGKYIGEDNLIPLCHQHHSMVHNQDKIYLKYKKKVTTVWPVEALNQVKLYLLQRIAASNSLEEALSLKQKLNFLQGREVEVDYRFPILIHKTKSQLYFIKDEDSKGVNVLTGEKKKLHCFFSGDTFFCMEEGDEHSDAIYDPCLSAKWLTKRPYLE